MALATPSTTAIRPVFNAPLVAACGGKLYIGYPGQAFAAAGNQSSAPLNAIFPISMAFLNLTVFAVDGITITTLPLATGNVTAYQQVVAALATPAAPILGQTGGGSNPPLTYYVQVVYVNAAGQFSLPSPESLFNVSASNQLTVTSPAASAGAVSYNVYVSLATGQEAFQANTAIGTPTTLPTTLNGAGATPLAGLTPTNCSLVANWRGHLVLAGDFNNPQNAYFSRAGVPTDWNYSALDPARAVATNLSNSGKIGEPITALIPYTDDVMLIGCANSLWMIEGDPADGGTIVQVSNNMGIVAKDAWTIAPDGKLYFVATGGLHVLRPLWAAYEPPQNLTEKVYPQFFQAITWGQNNVQLVWDADRHYLHIYNTLPAAAQSTHIIWDSRNGGLWPVAFPTNVGPTASCAYLADATSARRAIVIGGQDGFLRKIDDTATDDDGTAISSTITLGPIHPSPEASLLSGCTIDLGELPAGAANGWNVNVSVVAGPDAYSVTEGLATNLHAVPVINYTMTNRQKTFRQRVRGAFFTLTLANATDTDYFAFESAILELAASGKERRRR